MIVTIHQPNFLPWLGFFHKAVLSDVFVLFDDVVFSNSPTYENHAQIKTQARPQWLTLPLSYAAGQKFHQVKVGRMNWGKLLRTVQYAYQKAPFFEAFFPGLSAICLAGENNLSTLNAALIKFLLDGLGSRVRIVRSSELGLGQDLCGAEHILGILRGLGATEYISGTGAGSRRYIREEDFQAAGIRLTWQQFTHPVYPQLHGEFMQGLSIIDLLFNCGSDAMRILTGKPA